MLELPNVTLVAMAGVDICPTVKALKYSSKEIKFGQVLLISHKKPWYLPSKIDYAYIPQSKNVYEWCKKVVFDLHKYINTDYIILIHSDGFIVNPSQWRDEFLNYDYIGSPWPLPTDDYSFRDEKGEIVRVGNSVSLRSKKLLELPSKLNIKWPGIEEEGFWHEDGFLSCVNKVRFEKEGVKYPSIELAKYFAHEIMIPEVEGITPFCFHKYAGTNARYPKFKKSKFLFKD